MKIPAWTITILGTALLAASGGEISLSQWQKEGGNVTSQIDSIIPQIKIRAANAEAGRHQEWLWMEAHHPEATDVKQELVIKNGQLLDKFSYQEEGGSNYVYFKLKNWFWNGNRTDTGKTKVYNPIQEQNNPEDKVIAEVYKKDCRFATLQDGKGVLTQPQAQLGTNIIYVAGLQHRLNGKAYAAYIVTRSGKTEDVRILWSTSEDAERAAAAQIMTGQTAVTYFHGKPINVIYETEFDYGTGE